MKTLQVKGHTETGTRKYCEDMGVLLTRIIRRIVFHMLLRLKAPHSYQEEHVVVDGATSSQWYEDIAVLLWRTPCDSLLQSIFHHPLPHSLSEYCNYCQI